MTALFERFLFLWGRPEPIIVLTWDDSLSVKFRSASMSRRLAAALTLCGTRKLQFFYAEILPELKNRRMPKIVNTICTKTIKVKNLFEIFGI